MRKEDKAEIHSIYDATERLGKYCEAHPDPELMEIHEQILGAVAAHAFQVVGAAKKRQQKIAKRPRARDKSGRPVSDGDLLLFYENYVHRHGRDRGWINAASLEFGINRQTVSDRYKKMVSSRGYSLIIL